MGSYVITLSSATFRTALVHNRGFCIFALLACFKWAGLIWKKVIVD